MQAESLWNAITALFFVGVFVTMFYLRRTKAVQVMDFQTGLRFRKGESYTSLPPGSYRTGPGLGPISVVDLRPHQFIVERVNFRDAVLANAIISVGGEIVVSDPQAAMNTFKNLVEDSVAIVREGLGLAASHAIVDPSQEGKEKLAAMITSEINRELQTRGVMIRNLEITELWARPLQNFVPTVSN